MTGQDPIAAPPLPEEPGQPQADTDPAAALSAKTILNEHKGKLAIGAAATLGLMIFYNWRQKKLAEEDPEAFAAIQKVRESIKAEPSRNRRAGDMPIVPPVKDKLQENLGSNL